MLWDGIVGEFGVGAECVIEGDEGKLKEGRRNLGVVREILGVVGK